MSFQYICKIFVYVGTMGEKNWRIRETALRIALKIWWEVGDDGNDIYDALQIIIFSYEPRLKKEHIVIKHIVKETTCIKKFLMQ